MIDLSGLYQVVPSEDPYEEDEHVAVPLLSVELRAEVKNFIAEVELVQKYQNKEDNPLEVVYYFPVEESCSVIGCQALLDGKEIVAKVQDRKKAELMYEKAKKEKKTAVLLTETRPDIFQLKLGSLSPGAECIVTVTIVMELPVEDTKTRLTIPTTIAPKYVTHRQHESSIVPKALSNILYKGKTPAPLSLTIKVMMKTQIRSVESPSHNIQTEMKEGGGEFEARVKLAGDISADLDRDIIVLIDSEEPTKPKILMEKGEDGTVAAMLTLVPRFEMKKQESECIFLIDCSGSMAGQSIKLAREALTVFLNSLPVDCHFNVYCFGSSYNKLFPSSQPLTDGTLEVAKSLLTRIDANLGGTEIYSPLQDILQQPLVVGKPRQVFVITDGQVSNTLEVIRLVRSHATINRLFSLGIGSSADRHLVQGMARAGGGTAEFLSYGEIISRAVVRQLRLGLQPCITEVSIDWGDREAGVEHCQAPSITPPLYDGTRLILYKMWESQARLADRVRITAKTPEGDLREELEISEESYTEGNLVHKMFARKMIQDLEERHGGDDISEEIKILITDLALKYNLASRFTSYIGVNEEANENEGYLVSRQVHNMVPRGTLLFDQCRGGTRNMMKYSRSSIQSDDDGIDVDDLELFDYLEEDEESRDGWRMLRSNEDESDVEGAEAQPSIGDNHPPGCPSSRSKVPQTDMEKLLALISLQTAAGSFRYDKSVLDDVMGACGDQGKDLAHSDRWITALIVAFIEQRFAAEKETWQLIIEKSREWLRDDALIEEAKKSIQ